MKKKVIVYVDGFNFYFGLRSMGWKCYYWLDLVKFFEMFMDDDKELVYVRYFTSQPKHNQGKNRRQAAFLTANKLNPKFKVHLGTFVAKKDPATLVESGYEEKMIDVKIALSLISDKLDDLCDISFLVSGDTDQVPAIVMLQEMDAKHGYFAAFPPNRASNELKSLSDAHFYLERYENRFRKCLLPETIQIQKGRVIYCPPKWLKPHANSEEVK